MDEQIITFIVMLIFLGAILYMAYELEEMPKKFKNQDLKSNGAKLMNLGLL